MNEIIKTKSSFTIKPITDSDISTTINTFLIEFLRDEPLNGSIRLFEEEESVTEHAEFCKNYLKNGISIMAVSQNGDVMGGIINNIKSRNDVDDYDECYDEYTQPTQKVVKFLHINQQKSDVFGQYPNVDRILDMNIIAVNSAYRGHGVCKALVNKSKELALELGCQMIYVECTSDFTAKAAEQFGFKCIYSLSYSDYVDEQGEIVFKTQLPHKYFKVFGLLL